MKQFTSTSATLLLLLSFSLSAMEGPAGKEEEDSSFSTVQYDPTPLDDDLATQRAIAASLGGVTIQDDVPRLSLWSACKMYGKKPFAFLAACMTAFGVVYSGTATSNANNAWEPTCYFTETFRLHNGQLVEYPYLENPYKYGYCFAGSHRKQYRELEDDFDSATCPLDANPYHPPMYEAQIKSKTKKKSRKSPERTIKSNGNGFYVKHDSSVFENIVPGEGKELSFTYGKDGSLRIEAHDARKRNYNKPPVHGRGGRSSQQIRNEMGFRDIPRIPDEFSMRSMPRKCYPSEREDEEMRAREMDLAQCGIDE